MSKSPHPSLAAEAADCLPEYSFIPVPTRSSRHDGWSADRQRRFIAALAAMGSVAHAARAVGMGVTSAYNLRRRAGAESFAAAWDAALMEGRDRAFGRAMERAQHGYWTPRFYRGQVVGHVHRYDDTMTIAALRASGVIGRGAK